MEQKNFNMYKLKIKLLSALSTPLMADTIWGHICYGILFNEGEESLSKFLNSYKNLNENSISPLILSNPFPKGMIPIPKIILEKEDTMNLQKYKAIKKKKKIQYLPVEKIIDKGKVNIKKLIEEELEKEEKSEYTKLVRKYDERMRNSIDRILGTTSEDAIFQVNEIWYSEVSEKNNIKNYKTPVFDIYVLSSYDKQKTKRLFEMGFSLGYGADASSGKGVIKIEGDIEDFEFPKNGNTGIALAPFVPTYKEYEYFKNERGLFAETWTKYPKVHNSNPKMTNPFKKPIVFYKEGATFEFENESNKMEKPFFLGQCLDNIHHIPEIMQYAITPVFWLNFE